MRHIKQIFFLILPLMVVFSIFSKDAPSFSEPNGSTLVPSVREMKKLKKNIILAYSQMEDTKTGQRFNYRLYGLHPKNCSFALRKLSRYENMKDFLSFVDLSHYEPKSNRLYLSLSHSLLPFKMHLNFILERIDRPGVYTFSFDKGFLKGLLGSIRVKEEKMRCLLSLKADWKGAKTGISPTVFELFSKTLGKIGAETLFRMSSTY